MTPRDTNSARLQSAHSDVTIRTDPPLWFERYESENRRGDGEPEMQSISPDPDQIQLWY